MLPDPREARLLLATGPADLAGVGHRVGYDSPSRFSREYRRQFGAPPGQDALRLREAEAVTITAEVASAPFLRSCSSPSFLQPTRPEGFGD